MALPPNALDRWLAAHEFADPPLAFNLGSSTGPRWTFGELAALGLRLDDLDSIPLTYGPPEGAPALREALGARYGVDAESVLVMTGASEPWTALCTLVAGPGANVVLPQPGYPAQPVVARALGVGVKPYALDPERGWAHTADAILAEVDAGTRLVLVIRPHNPTGVVMPQDEVARLAAALAPRGIPLVVDEVYAPLTFGDAYPSAAGLPNTVVLGDMSKALSLAGLRLGWIVDPDPARREALVDARSYFSISNAPLNEALATFALANERAILDRLMRVARANLAVLDRFMAAHADLFGWVRPQGGTTAFPWVRGAADARPLCEALARAGVLVVPGDCFGAPGHVRIGFAAEADRFADALAAVAATLQEAPSWSSPSSARA